MSGCSWSAVSAGRRDADGFSNQRLAAIHSRHRVQAIERRTCLLGLGDGRDVRLVLRSACRCLELNAHASFPADSVFGTIIKSARSAPRGQPQETRDDPHARNDRTDQC